MRRAFGFLPIVVVAFLLPSFSANALAQPERSAPPVPYDRGSSFTELRGPGCEPHCGKILIAGGFDAGGCPQNNAAKCRRLASAALYDPYRGSWTPVGSLKEPRNYHFALVVSGPECGRICGQVLVFGGKGDPGPGSAEEATRLASAELFDPKTGEWKAAKGPKSSHQEGAAILIDGPNCGSRCGNILLAGGYGEPPPDKPAEIPIDKTAELFDPMTAAWRPAAPPLTGRTNSTAIVLSGPNCADNCGRVLLAGDRINETMSAELYDPAADSWAPAGRLLFPMPESCNPCSYGGSSVAAVQLTGGRVLVPERIKPAPAAGNGETPAPGVNCSYDEGSGCRSQSFDPATATWSAEAPLKFGGHHGAVALEKGGALAFGRSPRVTFRDETDPEALKQLGPAAYPEVEEPTVEDVLFVQRYDPAKKDAESGLQGTWEVAHPVKAERVKACCDQLRPLPLTCATGEAVLTIGGYDSAGMNLYSPDRPEPRQIRRSPKCGAEKVEAAPAPADKGAGTEQGNVSPALLYALGAVLLAISATALLTARRRRNLKAEQS